MILTLVAVLCFTTAGFLGVILIDYGRAVKGKKSFFWERNDDDEQEVNMKLSLKDYRKHTRYLLRDFDIEATDDIRAQLKACKSRIELEKVRDELIKQRLKQEV